MKGRSKPALGAVVCALLLSACGPRFDVTVLSPGAGPVGPSRTEVGAPSFPAVPSLGSTPGSGAVGALPTQGGAVGGGGGLGGGRGAVVRGGTIKVGGLFPLTGGLSALGKPAFEGAQAYFNHLNARGGVAGKKIEFVVCDDQADDTKSTTCAKRLVEQDDVFMMGPSFTPFSLTVINQLRRAGVPWVGYDGINVEGYAAENVVTVGAPIETMGHGLLPHWYDLHAKNGRAPKRIGAVVLESGPAQTYLREAKDVLCPRLGCTIVREASVGYTTTQYGTICRSMQSQSVDAIWVITDPASAIKLMVGCRDVAQYRPPLGFLGQHGIYLDLTLNQSGSFARGMLANSALLPPSVSAPATNEMRSIIRTYYPNAELGYFTELAYASARLVADVIERTRAAELTRAAVLDAAKTMTSYDCHGLCKDVNLAPPAARTGGNHNIWIVRSEFTGEKGRWVYAAGPIDAYAVKTWPCPNRPRPC